MIDVQQYILSKFPGKTPNSGGKIHTYCPFHDDRHPSFSIDLDKGGLFICGSGRCGVRGNFPLFYKMMENITSWREVYKVLKQPQVSKTISFDLGMPKKSFQTDEQIDDFPAPPFTEVIEDASSISYLQERGLTDEVCDAFGVAYGKGGEFAGVDITNTLIAPIFDLGGQYKTFQVRKIGAAKKYRWDFTPGSSAKKYLYAGWMVSQGDGYLWIVEGISDVWNLFMYGIQAVAIFSTEASYSQLNKINHLCGYMNLTPVVCLDGDVCSIDPMQRDAGEDLRKEISAYGLNCKTIYLEGDEDPGSLTEDRVNFVRSECYGGRNEYRQAETGRDSSENK